jgi:hypothetical protein
VLVKPSGHWKYAPEQFPGLARDSPWIDDHEAESPDGQWLAVLYGALEVRMGWVLGHVAILGAPRSAPEVNFCGGRRRFIGFLNSVSWIGDHSVLSTQPCLYRPSGKVVAPFLFIDPVARKAAVYPAKLAWLIDVTATNEGWTLVPGHESAEQRVELRRDDLHWFPVEEYAEQVEGAVADM